MYLINFRKLINPAFLLLAAIILRPRAITFQPEYLQLLAYMPYLLLCIVVSLCFYYNRARLFVATVSLLLVYYLIQSQLQTTLNHPHTMLVYSLIGVMHPLSLLFLLFLPERGLFNRHGFLLFAILVSIIITSLMLVNYQAGSLEVLVTNWFPVKPFTGLVLSIPASIFYILVIGLSLYRLARGNDDFALMIIVVALFSFTAMAKLDLANISTVMFSAASISLLIGLVGSSYDMAYRDELTGLPGRRALNDRLKGLGRQYAIAMMDIDHFKKFNDTYGHDIGDEVLKMVAQQIGAVKGGGRAYRYGGEEFCVIFAGKDIEYCHSFLEDVRLDVQDYPMTVRDNAHRPKSEKTAEQRRGRRQNNRNEKSVSVTMSIGVAETDESKQKPEDVLKAADRALYRAKKKGRNCLVT